MNILEQTWGGNSVLRWAIALGLIVLMPIVVKIVDVILAKKAHITIDGQRSILSRLVDVLRKPASTLIRFAFFWVVVREVLVLPNRVRVLAETGIYLGAVLVTSWLAADLAEKAVEFYMSRSKDSAEMKVNDLLRPLFRRFAAILSFGFILLGGLDHGGYDVRAILAGLGIGGLALAMASKDLLADLLGGLYILVNRPFAIGDKILYKDKWTTVIEFGLRTTTLRDFDVNHKFIVPNGQFTASAIVNISDHPGSMIVMNIRLSLTNEAEKIALALTLIQEILKGHTEVRYIWSKLDHFDDYAFTLRIHYDILVFKDRIRIKSEINLAIARAFQKNGIKFAALPVHSFVDQASDGAFLG
jgi:MscS family membrane protein